ncbi:hypothetical protein MAP00_001753 [Monascus purpureus]|nr:hypothetical protein MAP00_001753 [Monascus purpureus]
MKPIIAVPAVLGLVYRAHSRKSLTPLGITAAFLTAIAHAVHPWSAPFFLLAVFYLGGTKVTKIKHDFKASLTLSATGSEGNDTQRTHNQVLANSIVASILSLLYAYLHAKNKSRGQCFSFGGDALDLLTVGIVANYAAVAADTFSSELGILSKSKPRLITSPTLRVVPPGTNGGVTATGLFAGILGATTIALTSIVLLPFCSDGAGIDIKTRVQLFLAVTAWGALGSVVDSILGGLLQASVIDKRTGKIVEGSGGKKVLIHPASTQHDGIDNVGSQSSSVKGDVHLRNTEAVANMVALKGSKATSSPIKTQSSEKHDPAHESRRVETGWDLLDNNGVNLLMASVMSLGGIAIASWVWDVPVR